MSSWCILDGTTNFVHAFPFVCISLGLIDERRPVLGVIVSNITSNSCFLSSSTHYPLLVLNFYRLLSTRHSDRARAHTDNSFFLHHIAPPPVAHLAPVQSLPRPPLHRHQGTRLLSDPPRCTARQITASPSSSPSLAITGIARYVFCSSIT